MSKFDIAIIMNLITLLATLYVMGMDSCDVKDWMRDGLYVAMYACIVASVNAAISLEFAVAHKKREDIIKKWRE